MRNVKPYALAICVAGFVILPFTLYGKKPDLVSIRAVLDQYEKFYALRADNQSGAADKLNDRLTSQLEKLFRPGVEYVSGKDCPVEFQKMPFVVSDIVPTWVFKMSCLESEHIDLRFQAYSSDRRPLYFREQALQNLRTDDAIAARIREFREARVKQFIVKFTTYRDSYGRGGTGRAELPLQYDLYVRITAIEPFEAESGLPE